MGPRSDEGAAAEFALERCAEMVVAQSALLLD